LSKRHHHLALATLILLLAAGLRLWGLGAIPPGFNSAEMASLLMTEHAGAGDIRVFDQELGQVEEMAYHVLQAALTGPTGRGLITLRLPSVWSGLLTLALLYALARRLYGPRAALLAAGLLAAGFWPALLSRLSLREALVPLWTVAALLALANAFHIRQRVAPETPTVTGFAVLGIVTASSLYVHWFGIFLAILITAAVAYLFMTRQPISRHTLGASIFAIVLSIIVIIPYLVTTLRLPEVSGIAALRAATSPEQLPVSVVDGLAAIFAQGDMNPAFNLPGRPLLGPVSAILLVTGLVHGLRYWRRPSAFLPVLAAAIAMLPALFSTRPGAFTALTGALPILILLAGRGADLALDALADRRPALRPALPWLAAALIAANFLWAGVDLLVRFPADPAVREAFNAGRGALAAHLDRTAHKIPTVVCSPRLQDTAAQPGDPLLLDLMMHRENVPLRYVDCANGLILAEGGAPQQFAFTDLAIMERIHPVLRVWLEEQPSSPVSGLPDGSVLRLDVARPLGDTVGRLLTTAPTGYAPESPGGAGAATLPVRFGGNITYLGYEPPGDPTYAPGDVVPVVTYWRTDGAVPPDLRIFTHVLSDPAAIVSQSSVINVWPPSLRNRDVFLQVSYVTLPGSVPPGQYDLSIGAYQAGSGARLPVFDGERARGDRLFLYQITVAAPGQDGG